MPRNRFLLIATLVMMVSGSCSNIITTPTLTPTSAPEKLKLINGEIDACLLISPSEVEYVLGLKVATKAWFATMGAVGCVYTSVSDDRTIFQTFVTTDATLKKVNSPYSAVETYESLKRSHLQSPEVYKINEIENFGDRAYSTDASFLQINILNNGIYYDFTTETISDGGIGYDALMKLAEIALQKMP
ncbi:MAG: hypothetical protein H7Y59_01190 [Anaerolineales bacterium]|nr:hypothetical protein [Anaerolineales bacterium]